MQEKIYFLGGNGCATLEDLIKTGYTCDAYGYHTFFRITFADEECTHWQCNHARRSFGDLYIIATTYFPATTKQELAYILLNKIERLRAFYCKNIDRIVFIRDGNEYSTHHLGIFSTRMGDDYDTNFKDGASMCYNDIVDLAKEYKYYNK